MKLRSFIVTLAALVLLAGGLIYRQSASALPPAPTTTITGVDLEDIEVTLRVTGIAHLIGDYNAKERLLVIPNHKGSDHELLVLVNVAYDSELLDKKRTVDLGGVAGATYRYDEYPDGYEVDLAASGWIRPDAPNLVFSEAGDETNPPAACPGGNVARTSLHWLPRMSVVNKDKAKVKDSHKRKDPKARNVLARMEIIDGALDAELQATARKFEFDTDGATGGGDSVQAVADYLVYRFKARVVPGQPFVLKARKFRGKKDDADEWVEIVRVKPIVKKVEIILANVVEDGFFEPRKIDEIEHFHHYYDALHKPKKNIRKAVAGDACSAGNDSGIECGPIRQP